MLWGDLQNGISSIWRIFDVILTMYVPDRENVRLPMYIYMHSTSWTRRITNKIDRNTNRILNESWGSAFFKLSKIRSPYHLSNHLSNPAFWHFLQKSNFLKKIEFCFWNLIYAKLKSYFLLKLLSVSLYYTVLTFN